MSLSGLSVCACGHVANHHGVQYGCGVRGCPCRRFDAQHVSLERHNAVIREANRRLAAKDRKIAELEAVIRDTGEEARKPECTCAMTEASMWNCEVHGVDGGEL